MTSNLAKRLQAFQAEMNALISKHTLTIKKSQDGESLPLPVLEGLVRRHSQCHCAVVKRLLAEGALE